MKILLALAVCLASLVCCAQEIMPRIGVMMTKANLAGTADAYHTSFAPGFLTGVEGWFPIKGDFGIAGDFLFTQKGWNSETKTPDINATGNTRVYYGELICLPYFRKSIFYFMAGPGLLYGLTGNVNETFVDNSNGQSVSYSHKIHFDDRTTGMSDFYMNQRVTMSGVLSVGVTLWEVLLVDVRYQISGMSSYTFSPTDTDNPGGTYHSLQLTTALRLKR